MKEKNLFIKESLWDKMGHLEHIIKAHLFPINSTPLP